MASAWRDLLRIKKSPNHRVTEITEQAQSIEDKERRIEQTMHLQSSLLLSVPALCPL
jgi:hypothetical protein